ncbi:MAG: hypothetical protein US25_C0011G0007 [Candidatus Moranbacteria bacterium GW2011_GWE1_36_7]|nr:MAG: hypothetical protein UR99_C0020G0006 [Candidatus Moranbacteria bacterium GW2011_GWD2_36_12]KKQ06141.1 MAG: hypothetical protein US16_C0023G0006 [Candidatus Moranbacteria bacterium GW2011_GWE2_36_40]KKQ15147.1 MAG: hypothetical protein US25_C0011G0007 [Candidatus Moranbacteria bacterium GW2011_GWE1_36_7]
MKVFIDFDDVIFNTKNFKHDFKNMFFENGISNEIFDKYYNDPNDSRAIKTFDPWLQIERIYDNEVEVDREKLNNLVRKFISDMSGYIFVDVLAFVNIVGVKNIFIVSFGEREFQTKKVLNSGIGKFIPNIVITDTSKAEAIAKILENEKNNTSENIFFIDDRSEQIRDVKEKFPNVITVLVKRPEGRYQEMQKEDCCDYEAHNLKEVEKIIKDIEKI